MCYLVAKHEDKIGCIATPMKMGKELSSLKKRLNDKVCNAGVQLVTISRPSAYGEYAPYRIVNQDDFVQETIRMGSGKQL